jgi:hypothetical protein
MKPVKGGQGPVWAVAPLIIIIIGNGGSCINIIVMPTLCMGAKGNYIVETDFSKV